MVVYSEKAMKLLDLDKNELEVGIRTLKGILKRNYNVFLKRRDK